jgi:hypothetical protein
VLVIIMYMSVDIVMIATMRRPHRCAVYTKVPQFQNNSNIMTVRYLEPVVILSISDLPAKSEGRSAVGTFNFVGLVTL